MMNNFIKKIINYYKEPPMTAIITLWLITVYLIGLGIRSNFNPQLNLLGDAMGGIFGTLLSSLTLIFVAYSFQLQHKSLEIQKKELEDTRNELAEQGRILKKDNFENTFFKLIEKQQNLLEKFQWGDKVGYEALYQNENSFIHDLPFFGRRTTPPLAEYISNYIGINEVIINHIESSFSENEDKKVYYKTLASVQSDIVRKMIIGYYTYKEDNRYLVLMEQYIPNYSSILRLQ